MTKTLKFDYDAETSSTKDLTPIKIGHVVIGIATFLRISLDSSSMGIFSANYRFSHIFVQSISNALLQSKLGGVLS